MRHYCLRSKSAYGSTCLDGYWSVHETYAPSICESCTSKRIRDKRVNVNELVNAELYARVATGTVYTVAYLKRNYTPQEMRGVLLRNKRVYYEGELVAKSCCAPKPENRGVELDFNHNGDRKAWKALHRDI